ncbi:MULTISPECIES: DUF1566 domain-containing protein [Methylomonas]|uniref:Lcl C-terminal domain-containing protein n=1 Tax=Methylomonas denitrificans TaxID=1538553 RepID=A0A140E5D7_9GAMM|nr:MULTISPECIES: DUF1566 domain-containing protein [Methylomonas]AMK75611.1 hypothetical protein JT25_003770 [Methylomonas denitrificans]OAI08874.1 hypothetical protein A1342_08505 [Methylomonas methanica]
MNTAIIVSTQVIDNQTRTFAAKVVADYSVQADGFTPCTGVIVGTCYGDWYLPSKYELNLLFQQKAVVGGFANDYYWSPTEINGSNAPSLAWEQDFANGDQGRGMKSNSIRVRAVRAF